MDFSWSAFFTGVIIALPLGWLAAGLVEGGNRSGDARKDRECRAEIRQLRWMICEMEAGRMPPAEYLANNRTAVEVEREIEETLQDWDNKRARLQGGRKGPLA